MFENSGKFDAGQLQILRFMHRNTPSQCQSMHRWWVGLLAFHNPNHGHVQAVSAMSKPFNWSPYSESHGHTFTSALSEHVQLATCPIRLQQAHRAAAAGQQNLSICVTVVFQWKWRHGGYI